MKKEKICCPCCGTDLTAYMHEAVVSYMRQKHMEKVNQALTKEQREQRIKSSGERLKKWRLDNPEAARNNAIRASSSRTEETFKRQGKTIRETARKKAIKFAELLAEAKNAGIELTLEVETRLMSQASEIIRAENRAERLKNRKKEK